MKGTAMPNYLWLDLETTGLDPYTDSILETAITITSEDLEPIRVAEWLIPERDCDWTDVLSPEVFDMHWQSGLIADLTDETQWLSHYRPDEVEAGILCRIEPFLENGKITLAGSGVASFDRLFIQEAWPDLYQKLNYWSLDIGVVRRFLSDVAGIDLPELGPVKHRAADDVAHHLAEARTYLRAFDALRWDVGNELHR